MNTFLLTVGIAMLFGIYDLFIKLGAGKISPSLGAMLTQTTSAFVLVGIFLLQLRSSGIVKQTITTEGIFFVVSAGILIAAALVLLFFLLQNKDITTATTLPVILILRNVTLVTLAVLVLRENLTLTKILGLSISLLGIYLISLK